MNLSVVIVAYRSRSLIRKLLKSLMVQTLQPDEIIIIDNGPKKDSFDFSNFGKKNKIKYVPQDENLGYGGGCNKGFLESKGKFVLFLNPDLTLNKNVLEVLYSEISQDKSLGALSCLIENENEDKEDMGGTLNPFLTTIPNWFKDPRKTFYPSGAVFITKREAWESVEGMDADFFLYGEDVNFGWKLRLAGWGIKKTHLCKVYHEGQGSVKKHLSSFKKYFYQERNRLLNWHSLNTENTRFSYAPWYGLNEIGRLVSSCLNIPKFFSLICAWLHIVFSFRYIRKKNQHINSIRKEKDCRIHKWFAPQWTKKKSFFDGFLTWGHDRIINPLKGVERFSWLILVFWIVGSLHLSKLKRGGWPDEVFTHSAISGSFENMLSHLANDVHPPGYFSLQWLFSSLFDPYGYILPVLFAWGAGRVLLRSYRKELKITAYVLWMLPFTFFIGTQFRYYSMVVFLLAWLIRLGDHKKPCNTRKVVGAILAYTTHLGFLIVWGATFLIPKKSTKNARRDAFFSSIFWIPGFFTLVNQSEGRLGNSEPFSDMLLESFVKTFYSQFSFIFGHYYNINPLIFSGLFLIPFLFVLVKNPLKKDSMNLLGRYLFGTFLFCSVLTFIIKIGVSFTPTRIAFLVIPLSMLFAKYFIGVKNRYKKILLLSFSVVSFLGYISTISNKGPFHCGYETPLARASIQGIDIEDSFIISERNYFRDDSLNGYMIANLADLVFTLQAMAELKPQKYLLFRETNKEDLNSTWNEIQFLIEENSSFTKKEGLIYERPNSHKFILDNIDRITGQKPEISCWKYIVYEVKQ
tara:strand:+ start:928 stop:3336 length:2409 start_codon:yes stop_codon:yes gene_type:complete